MPGMTSNVRVTFQKNYYQAATTTPGEIELYYIKDVGNLSATANSFNSYVNAKTSSISITTTNTLPAGVSFNSADFTGLTGVTVSTISGSGNTITIYLSNVTTAGSLNITLDKEYYTTRQASVEVKTGAVSIAGVTQNGVSGGPDTSEIYIELDTEIEGGVIMLSDITITASEIAISSSGSVTWDAATKTLTVPMNNSSMSGNTDTISAVYINNTLNGYSFAGATGLSVECHKQ
jgi:hypothetical protein